MLQPAGIGKSFQPFNLPARPTALENAALPVRLNREERAAVVIVAHDPAIFMQRRRRAPIRDGMRPEDGAEG